MADCRKLEQAMRDMEQQMCASRRQGFDTATASRHEDSSLSPRRGCPPSPLGPEMLAGDLSPVRVEGAAALLALQGRVEALEDLSESASPRSGLRGNEGLVLATRPVEWRIEMNRNSRDALIQVQRRDLELLEDRMKKYIESAKSSPASSQSTLEQRLMAVEARSHAREELVS